jgi:RimJ/RimL family protein N-acetyltransferase
MIPLRRRSRHMGTGEHDAPILNIIGEKVALGPIRREHIPLILRWNNDFSVLRTTGQVRPLTLEALERDFEHSSKATDEVHFTIYDRATLRPIGGVNLHNITGRTATFAIAIGEKDFWGKGYGTEATKLVLDYGFHALGLHNIMLTVHSYNTRGIRAYVRAGFREIGRRREVINRGGRLHDLLYMDCLATEFKSPVLQRLLLDEQPVGEKNS